MDCTCGACDLCQALALSLKPAVKVVKHKKQKVAQPDKLYANFPLVVSGFPAYLSTLLLLKPIQLVWICLDYLQRMSRCEHCGAWCLAAGECEGYFQASRHKLTGSFCSECDVLARKRLRDVSRISYRCAARKTYFLSTFYMPGVEFRKAVQASKEVYPAGSCVVNKFFTAAERKRLREERADKKVK
jgi:hypothetical protein